MRTKATVSVFKDLLAMIGDLLAWIDYLLNDRCCCFRSTTTDTLSLPPQMRARQVRAVAAWMAVHVSRGVGGATLQSTIPRTGG